MSAVQVLREHLLAAGSSYMRSSRRLQAQQICSGQQNSVQEPLLSSVPVNRINSLRSGLAEAVPKIPL